MTDQPRIWFLYQVQTKNQIGPLTLPELLTLKSTNQAKDNDFVFRQGMENWVAWKDVPELVNSVPPIPPAVPSKVKRPDRVLLMEEVVAHNDFLVASGRLRNISENGVFLETDQLIFKDGEILKITIKEGKDLGKPINIRGRIVRTKLDRPLGYGLELIDLDSMVRKRIVTYIERQKK